VDEPFLLGGAGDAEEDQEEGPLHELRPEDSVSQVGSVSQATGVTEHTIYVSSAADAEKHHVASWNATMEEVSTYLSLPAQEESVAKRQRLQMPNVPIVRRVQPTRLTLHGTVLAALDEFQEKAKDPKVTKFSPGAKFKTDYYDPVDAPGFLKPAESPKTWALKGLGKEPEKTEDDPLKAKEGLFREMLAGQSTRMHLQDVMVDIIGRLPESRESNTLKGLSSLVSSVSLVETEYTSTMLANTIVRRRDLRLGKPHKLTEEEASHIRGSSFRSNNLLEGCSAELVKEVEDRKHKELLELAVRQKTQPQPVQVNVTLPGAQKVTQKVTGPQSKPSGPKPQTAQKQPTGASSWQHKGQQKKKNFRKKADGSSWSKPNPKAGPHKGSGPKPKGGKAADK
jgi:hypothetical protein